MPSITLSTLTPFTDILDVHLLHKRRDRMVSLTKQIRTRHRVVEAMIGDDLLKGCQRTRHQLGRVELSVEW